MRPVVRNGEIQKICLTTLVGGPQRQRGGLEGRVKEKTPTGRPSDRLPTWLMVPKSLRSSGAGEARFVPREEAAEAVVAVFAGQKGPSAEL